MQNVYTQEGALESPMSVVGDHINKYLCWFIGQRESFEKALRERCDKEDVALEVKGFEPRLKMYIYILNGQPYGVKIDKNGINHGRL